MPDKAPAVDRSKIRRGLLLAVSISAFALVVISLLTMQRETLSALSRISPLYVAAAVFLSLGRWLWSALRMRILVSSTGKRVPFFNLVKTVYGGYFTGIVTPWRAGGVAGETVFLYHYGLGAGEATAVVSFGACISTVLLILFFPLAIWLAEKYVRVTVTVKGFLFSALGIGVIFLALVLLALLRPQATVGKPLARRSPAFLKGRKGYRRFLERLSEETNRFALALRALVNLGWKKILLATLLTLLYWVTGFLAVPVAMLGLGYGSYFWNAIVAQLIVQLLLPFIPTPGSSGIGEVGFLFVYGSILPDMGAAALLTLVWRFIDFYVGLVVGGGAFLIIMRDLDRTPRRAPAGGPSDREGSDEPADALPGAGSAAVVNGSGE